MTATADHKQVRGGAVLPDFCLHPIFAPSFVRTDAGGYRAPEVLDTRRPTLKADVYSLGVLLLELLTGKSPTAGGCRRHAGPARLVQSVARKEWMAEVFDVELVWLGASAEEEMAALLQAPAELRHRGNNSKLHVGFSFTFIQLIWEHNDKCLSLVGEMPCGGLPQPQQRSRNLQQHLRHPPNELESNGNTSYGYNAANGYYGVFTASGILNDPSKGNHSGFIAPYPKLRSLGRWKVRDIATLVPYKAY
uniref:Putative inactive receptor kinase n=1 Tax=Aegilops tauschii TaxID=37682 RepID=N1QSX1_AEGTA